MPKVRCIPAQPAIQASAEGGKVYGMGAEMMMVKRLCANESGRDFIVGDLHGCTAELAELMDGVGFDRAKDRLFSVGDLIDRGPDSCGCLDLIGQPWFFPVLGNHEQMLMMAVADPTNHQTRGWWFGNGGSWSMAMALPALETIALALDNLPLVYVVGEGDKKFNVLHAEFYGTQSELEEGNYSEGVMNVILWGRSILAHPEKAGNSLATTYVGHTPLDKPLAVGPFRFIDTGAFKPHLFSDQSGSLTMVEHGGNIYSVSIADSRMQSEAANEPAVVDAT